MKTPKEWSKNLKKRLVTEDMLEAALFSVNKRAKNWRDKKREYKRYRHADHDYAGEAEAQEDRMYKKKDLLLSAVKPVCIHQESWGCERKRIYNFGTEHSDAELSAIYKGLIVHTGSFVSHSRSRYDYGFCHETAEKLVHEAWESCRESYDAANNFWHVMKKAEKRERKGKKKKGRR